MIADRKLTVDDCIAYAEKVEPYACDQGGNGLSRNEQMIVLLANEVTRLRVEVIHAKRRP